MYMYIYIHYFTERKKALTLGWRDDKIQAQLGIEPRSLVLRTSALTTELSRHSCEPR